MLQRLKDTSSAKTIDTIDPSIKVDEITPDNTTVTTEDIVIIQDASIGNIDVSINVEVPKEEVKEDISQTREKQYGSMIQGGVEVVDVKAIEKKKKLNQRPGNRYNFGIPINKGEGKNFDKIG